VRQNRRTGEEDKEDKKEEEEEEREEEEEEREEEEEEEEEERQMVIRLLLCLSQLRLAAQLEPHFTRLLPRTRRPHPAPPASSRARSGSLAPFPRRERQEEDLLLTLLRLPRFLLPRGYTHRGATMLVVLSLPQLL
jgi:hypothetical protein